MSFDALPHADWPAVAACLSRPWPRAAVLHDLRWHAVEHHVYHHRLPATRDLADRWGWTQASVSRCIRAGEWCDEARPWAWAMTQPRLTGDSPVTHHEQANADNHSAMTQPRLTGDSPVTLTRDLLVDHPSPITHHPHPERARAEQPGQPPPPDSTAVREYPAHREDRPSLTTPRPPPPRPPAPDVDPDLVAIVGARGDLLMRLLRPGDSSVDPILTLPALLDTSMEELRYRPGIGGARAETLRRLLADHDLELPRTAEDAERARKEREYDEEMRRDDAERAARDRQRDDNVIPWRNNAAK